MAVSLIELLRQAGINAEQFEKRHICSRIGVVAEGFTANSPVGVVVTKAEVAMGYCKEQFGNCSEGCWAQAIVNAARKLGI